jgi:hypothetical protein
MAGRATFTEVFWTVAARSLPASDLLSFGSDDWKLVNIGSRLSS